MIKHLTKHGNSLALVIDKPVLELLKVDTETDLEISTDGQVLIITPIRDKERKTEFQRAVNKANNDYAATLKRLAE